MDGWGFVGFSGFRRRRIQDRCQRQRNRQSGLDVVVVDVSGIDVAVMGGNGVDSGGVGDLGVRVKGCHDGGVVETVAVNDDCVGIHCRCFVFSVADLVGRSVHGW